MTAERHTPFYELWDALAVPDRCPICHLVQQRSRTFVQSLFMESVNDPGVRQHLHDSLGFGGVGAHLAEELHDGLGLSMIYAALATDLHQRLAHANTAPRATRACPVTEMGRATESRYIAEFARHYAEPDVQARHQAGPGLCLKHLTAAAGNIADAKLRQKLMMEEGRKFAHLAAELNRFVARNDYQNTIPFGPERDAWLHALRKFHHDEPP